MGCLIKYSTSPAYRNSHTANTFTTIFYLKLSEQVASIYFDSFFLFRSLGVSEIVFPVKPELSCALIEALGSSCTSMAREVVRADDIFEAFFSMTSKTKLDHLSRASNNLDFTLGSLISDTRQTVVSMGDPSLLAKALVTSRSWKFAYEPGKMDDWQHNTQSAWEKTGKYNYVQTK